MNYPDTHNSVYLKYGDDPFGFNAELYSLLTKV
jgi:hypothetical protein